MIYHWQETTETFYLLFAYRKNEQEELTVKQIKMLAKLVQEEFQ